MDYRTGHLGIGGASRSTAAFRFRGKLGRPFMRFALERAARLGLDGWIEADPDGSILVLAEGPGALLDAFEITCSLGPINASIDNWTREDMPPGVNARGFSERRC